MRVTLHSYVSKLAKHVTYIRIRSLPYIKFHVIKTLRTLMNAFIESQCNYYPLIWKFHSRTLNNKISRIQVKALRPVYSDYNSSFTELLNKDGYFTIHQRNVQSLSIEIYKYLHGSSPVILREVFKVDETIPHDLRMPNRLYIRNPKTDTVQKLYLSCLREFGL